MKDETATIDVYTRQIYNLAKINSVKHKYIQRAMIFVIIAIATELAIIAYLFLVYLGEGVIPPII